MIRLATTDADFADRFTALVEDRRESDAGVTQDVAAIIASVRRDGETALRDLTQKHD